MLLKLATVCFTLGFASASRSTNAPVSIRHGPREICWGPCFDICKGYEISCLCGPASSQNMLACATCRTQTDTYTVVSQYEYIDNWRKECAKVGVFIPPLIIPTGTPSAVISTTPASTSTPTPSSVSKSTPSLSASPSAVPTTNTTGTTYTTAVLVASIISSVVLAGSVAALLVWYFCVRRRRNTRFDLGDSEETDESKGSPQRDNSVTTSRDTMIEPKPAYDSPHGRSNRPTASNIPFASNSDDEMPLLTVSHDGSRDESNGDVPADPLLSPSAASDGRTWTSIGHSSELSDDGRPFVGKKKSPRSVIPRGIPAVNDPAANLVSGQELDQIATTIASMLSTPAPPPPMVLGPVHHDEMKI